MDLQVVSSLASLPLVSGPIHQAVGYYTDIKKQYPLANQLFSNVETNLVKAQNVAAPYLAKYHPQIEQVDQFANEQVVKRLLTYCGPVVQKTPTELSEETKKRVNDAVENVRHRAVQTKAQLYAAPGETVQKGRELINAQYQFALSKATDKAQRLRTDVPAMLPESARQYLETLWSNYSLEKRYETLIEMANTTTDNLKKMYSENTLSADYMTSLRHQMDLYWKNTMINFEATSGLVYDSYNWLLSSRLAAVATARQTIDNSLATAWVYASDFSREFSETYAHGSRSDIIQLASRKISAGRDLSQQLSRWTFRELVSLQDASTSVLDMLMASWMFHWITFYARPAPTSAPNTVEISEVQEEEEEQESSSAVCTEEQHLVESSEELTEDDDEDDEE